MLLNLYLAVWLVASIITLWPRLLLGLRPKSLLISLPFTHTTRIFGCVTACWNCCLFLCVTRVQIILLMSGFLSAQKDVWDCIWKYGCSPSVFPKNWFLDYWNFTREHKLLIFSTKTKGEFTTRVDWSFFYVALNKDWNIKKGNFNTTAFSCLMLYFLKSSLPVILLLLRVLRISCFHELLTEFSTILFCSCVSDYLSGHLGFFG